MVIVSLRPVGLCSHPPSVRAARSNRVDCATVNRAGAERATPLLKIPYYLSSGWLKIDPNFAPLRSNLRFQTLLAQGS